MNRFVLDTGVLIHYIRKSTLYQKIESEQNLTAADSFPLISVTTKAELISFGIQNNWQTQKLHDLSTLLDKIPIIDINSSDSKLMDAYAELDAFSKGKLASNPLGRSAIKMGKNDLWIAATTVVTSSSLITLDGDFDHLNSVFIPVIKY